MTSATTPPELAGIERAVDALLVARTIADVRGDGVGLQDFRDALVCTHNKWISGLITTALGPYVNDQWYPADIVMWMTGAWSSIATDYMAIVTDLLNEIQKLTGKAPDEALRELRELRERADRGLNDA